MVETEAEFHALSNGTLFMLGHPTKKVVSLKKLIFFEESPKFFCSGFAIVTDPALKMVDPDSVSNSASIDINFVGGHRAKNFLSSIDIGLTQTSTLTWVENFLLDDPL